MINNIFVNNKDAIVGEYEENRLLLMSEMFKHMMAINDLSEELNKQSADYRGLLMGTEHPKAWLLTFDRGLFPLWKRFILDGNHCKYTQAQTSNLYPFEEDYFNNK